jgi:hypothetical protein
MTHYHYYIECGQILNEDARIWVVGVGTSAQAQRDYLFLVAYAAEHNHYFALRSEDSSRFVLRVTGSLGLPDDACRTIKARDLVRYFKAGDAMPFDSAQLLEAHRQRCSLSLSYRISSRLSAAGKNRYPARNDKNLKP